ncbi:hypothetical protein [Nocardia gamkensis]|uniref:Uncharacterized protein n=1 Tax=Nocardia gamkensis TaxID=352869 RepID=A0A7X6R3R1_9NOCA|nr:hypothetical protein [Nocardia gamkensis]NKY27729.1 hypothetical protein [Nocardia gamkensis]NQE67366.1 hypothetical protein [Nocardia gamkensis]
MDRSANHHVVLNELQPKVPQGDDLETVSDIVNFVLRRSLRLSRDIQRYAGQRADQAPTSSRLALAFAGLVANEAIEWVRRWPR